MPLLSSLFPESQESGSIEATQPDFPYTKSLVIHVIKMPNNGKFCGFDLRWKLTPSVFFHLIKDISII